MNVARINHVNFYVSATLFEPGYEYQHINNLKISNQLERKRFFLI
jgi:hypothetical protein